MAARHPEDFDVVGAQQIRQHLRAGRRDELVLLRDDDQRGHGDVREPTARPPSRAPPLISALPRTYSVISSVKAAPAIGGGSTPSG